MKAIKMKSVCKNCNAEFEHRPWQRGAYCSTACFRANPSTRRHGHSHSPTYVSWRDMKCRCLNPSRKEFDRYGGRGIAVCERWMTFDNFLADMGEKPGKGFTIERNDTNGHYEPGNCRWATVLEQNRNKSNTYTAEQDAKIRECVSRGLNFRQMAEVVGKPRGSVMARTYRLGLKSGTPPIPPKIITRSAV